MRARVVAVLASLALAVGVLAVVAVPSQSASVVRITAAGDFGARSATDAVLRKVAELGPDLHLALGDLAYGDAAPESAWCAYVKQRVGEGFPFELLAGNHESHDLKQGYINNYSACLPNQVPGVVGTYGREYYLDVPQPSPVARVIQASPALTFEDGRWDYAAGDAHYAWVADAIDDARADGLQWVIVAAHVPCLSAGIYGCPAPRDFYDLLLAKRVDLVLHGHEHAYLRSHQLVAGVPGCSALDVSGFDADCVVDTDDTFAAGAGTVFATVGTGGIPLRDLNLSSPNRDYFASLSGKNANPTYGLLDLTITADRLQAGFVAASGGDHSDAFVIDTSETPPNPPPTARFTVADDGLSVSVDGAGSTDDGSIVSYAWDFGDGNGGTGVRADHTYAAGGTYAITLTVTDDEGAQGTAVRQATVSDGSGEIQTVALAPTDDSYVRTDRTSSNYGGSNQFHTLSTSPALIPYLGFALPEAPAGTTLVGASLRLRTTTTSSSGSPATHTVDLAAEAFDEATITYANRPASAGVALGQVVPAQADTAYEIPLDTGAVAGKLGGPMAVSVVASGSRDLAHLWSKEHVVASYRPQLTLEFEGPATNRTVAAFLGDSYTAGTGASTTANRWSSLVATDQGWTEENFGAGGTGYLLSAGPNGCGKSYCPEYFGRLGDVAAADPDVVLISGGQNDLSEYAADPAAGRARVEETYAEARRLMPDATLIAVGPSSPVGSTATFVALDEAVQSGAAAAGATYISLLEPDAIEPSMVLPDGAHVGDDGHRAIADRVLAGLP